MEPDIRINIHELNAQKKKYNRYVDKMGNPKGTVSVSHKPQKTVRTKFQNRHDYNSVEDIRNNKIIDREAMMQLQQSNNNVISSINSSSTKPGSILMKLSNHNLSSMLPFIQN